MQERYSRNRIYVDSEAQEKVRRTHILLGGAGIGSIIAECALRFGFEHITIVDGDSVELSNLNRQNYTVADLGRNKAEALVGRLRLINPEADIRHHAEFVTHSNAADLVAGHDLAINALDFKSDIPFVFDRLCRERNIPVLHPYNLGWAGFLTVAVPDGRALEELSDGEPLGFELRMAEYVLQYNAFWHNGSTPWLDEVIARYRAEGMSLPPPQLAVGSWVVAGMCVRVMYDWVTGREVRAFPKFYLAPTWQ